MHPGSLPAGRPATSTHFFAKPPIEQIRYAAAADRQNNGPVCCLMDHQPGSPYWVAQTLPDAACLVCTGGMRSTDIAAGNRRTRIGRHVAPQLRAWLQDCSRIHAHLCSIVRLYSQPDRAGGAGLEGDCYTQRLAAGDPSVLHDALGVAADHILALRAEIGAWMDDVQPTDDQPGSPGKLQTMVDRAAVGRSLFCDRDAKIDVA